MQSAATHKMAPVETSTNEDQVHDAVRLERPMSNMLGAVVVGPYCSSDCFEGIGELQAGNPDPNGGELSGKDPSGDNWREEW